MKHEKNNIFILIPNKDSQKILRNYFNPYYL